MISQKYIEDHVPQEIKTAVDNMNDKLKAEWSKRKGQRNMQMIFKLYIYNGSNYLSYNS